MNQDDRGIVVLFAYSLGYAERVVVMLHTLRRWWPGPVLLLLDDTTLEVGSRIADDPRIKADVRVIDPYRGSRHAAYVTKTMVPDWSPYGRTLLIDGDTAIAGRLDELFEPSLVITQFSDWHSQGRLVSNRIGWWRGRSDYIEMLVDRQLSQSYPAINTGVVAWHRGHPALVRWRELTLAGAGLHMTDEIAMQLLSGDMPTEQFVVFDDRWNCSAIYGVHRDDIRVWHHHGRKHLRRAEGRALWLPLLYAAMQADIGGVREWAGRYDPLVKVELER